MGKSAFRWIGYRRGSDGPITIRTVGGVRNLTGKDIVVAQFAVNQRHNIGVRAPIEHRRKLLHCTVNARAVF